MKTLIQIWKIALMIVLMVTSVAILGQSERGTVFTEDFESGWGSWWADNGVWEIGIPTVGPENTPSGQNCAGTVLDGNYPNSANTRLISPSITLPGLSQDEQIKLKFWHWYRMDNNYADYDYGFVQISVDDGDTWETISGNYDEYSPVWTQVSISLSDYVDSTILIAFSFNTSSNDVDNGWYIDDVRIEGIITGINESTSLNSNESMLNQNYPNPFTHQTKIEYNIPSDENVRLSIYNINGELVKIIVDEKQKRGDYSVTWQGKNEQNKRVSPGIYFYELKTGNDLIRKKMLLLK